MNEKLKFICSDCGLAHDHKEGEEHSVSNAFSKTFLLFLEVDLKYNPDCHCGWHELNAKIQLNEIQDIEDYASSFIKKRCKELIIPEQLEQEIYIELI